MKKKFLFYIVLFIFSKSIFAIDNYNDYILQLESKNYYMSCYYDVLRSENRDFLKNYDKYSKVFDDEKWEEPEGWVIHKWYEDNFFYFEKIEASRDLDKSLFDNYLVLGGVFIIKIESLFQDNKTTIRFKELGYGKENTWYNSTLLDWKILRKTNSNTFIFIEDGDYIHIYYDEEQMLPFASYAVMNENSFEQFKNLIYYNKCDLSKVTWPKHADGSCDYDISKKTAAIQTLKQTSSTNVAKNKIMLVNENLKLRSGEATSTQVLSVMSAGTKVKILELGKAETIDDISSNWVKVEVQAGAKDRDGKVIKAGTVGWCYGGYLK